LYKLPINMILESVLLFDETKAVRRQEKS